jgi:uncharacterized membrane protein required for colicin V production
MDTLPEISLGTAALVIFGCCAGYMLLRGVARTIVNAASLTFSAWVGFRIWQQAPSLAIAWFGTPPEFVLIGLPVAAFLVTLLLLCKVIGCFLSPLPRSSGDVAPRSGGQLFFRLLITLIPAALLCLIAATLVHHAGSVAEIRDSVNPSWAGKMKKSLSAAIPAELMDWLDPMASEPRVRLAKMIAARPEPLQAVIDPETGKPYPRAIIVDDPELADLARKGRFSTILRHPLLSEALKDPLIRQALGL